jgi:hypothetical protein
MECKALEKLAISDAEEIKDISPILNHPTLKTLRAGSDMEAKFADREALQKLGTTKTNSRAVSDALNAGAHAAEKALADLCLFVRSFSTNESNALDLVFSDKMDDYYDDDTVILPEVDTLLEKYGVELSAEVLASLVEMTLWKINGRCYSTTIPVVKEIIRRGDIDGQMRTVAAYIAACKYYDAGHRRMDGGVQDQLIDKLFPKFKAAPLAELLAWCGTDHLNSETGDSMDALFAPAFADAKATGNTDATKRLEKTFLAYYEEAKEYNGLDYFKSLISELKPYFEDASAFEQS